MEKIIEKIGSYHIFNNLVPGYLFIIINSKIIDSSLLNDNLIYSFFEAYFIGVIISRLSSLVIEVIISKIWNLKNVSYDKYIEVNKKDSKLEVLNQDCNMYRSLCTLMIIEIILNIMSALDFHNLINNDLIIILLFVLLAILFAYSFVKQKRYILSRVIALYKTK